MGVPVNPMKEALGSKFAHVSGVAVDEVILTAMGFIRNDDDVVSIRKRTTRLSRGHELLNGRKEDAARNAP